MNPFEQAQVWKLSNYLDTIPEEIEVLLEDGSLVDPSRGIDQRPLIIIKPKAVILGNLDLISKTKNPKQLAKFHENLSEGVQSVWAWQKEQKKDGNKEKTTRK